jgi:hypothetical protein
VTTESEDGAEKDGLEVLRSGEDGRMPDIPGVDWDKFDPTWRYNPALEALAPNFGKYKTLKNTLQKDKEGNVIQDKKGAPLTMQDAVEKAYRQDMEKTHLSFGDMKLLHDRMRAKDYGFTKKQAINCRVGDLEKKRFRAIQQDDGDEGFGVYMTIERIHHAFRQKGDATIPADCMADAYYALQEPDVIFIETSSRHGEQARVFHFVKRTKKKKIINAILEKKDGFAFKVRTIDLEELDRLLSAGDLTEVYPEKEK